MSASTRVASHPAATNAVVGAVAAALVVWVGPPGPDFPAHLFQLHLYVRHGFELWTNYWYSGRYTFVGYSLLYYPLAAIIGIKLLAVLSVAAAAGAFTALVGLVWHTTSPWAGRLFAIVCAATLVTAAFPWGLGVAFALAALVVLRRGRTVMFALLAVLACASSPLAFLFLMLVLAAAWVAGHRKRATRPAAAIAGICCVGLVVWRLFPDGGRYPFPLSELAAALVFCALGIVFTWRVEDARLLLSLFVAYGCLCLLSFALPSAVGGNVVRLRYAALPLAVLTLSLRRWRPLPASIAVLALAASWNVTPLAYSFVGSTNDRSASASYWAPVVSFLHRSLPPGDRVEVVGTAEHWEAVYLPQAGIPIVRGWFRQDDFPQNRLLYRARLTRAGYLAWLRALAARYVVLTDSRPDYSSLREAALLESGRSGLRIVDRTRHATIYAVPSPRALVSGPGSVRVLSFTGSTVRLAIRRPGAYRLGIRYSPYLVASPGCLAPARGGMTSLRLDAPGRVEITFKLSVGGALAALTGDQRECRPRAG